MFLSQLHLNRRNRGVQRDLGSPDAMHKTLWRALPTEEAGGPGRALFRIEPTDEVNGGPPHVLVQSEKEPDWSALPPGYAVRQQLKRLRYVAEADHCSDAVVLSIGNRFRFRLLANPAKKSEGKRHGLYSEEAQRGWLERKAEAGGFRIIPQSLLVVPMGMLSSRGAEQADRKWYGVRFEGGLEVTDPALFAATLTEGIGSAKAFGFGLLSIAAR